MKITATSYGSTTGDCVDRNCHTLAVVTITTDDDTTWQLCRQHAAIAFPQIGQLDNG